MKNNKALSIILEEIGKNQDTISEKDIPQACDIISQTARKVGHPFVNFEGSLELYDGKRWVITSDFELKVFLKAALTLLFGDSVKGSTVKNIDSAFKQMGYTTMEFSCTPPEYYVNFQNGILDLSGSKPVIVPHTPDAHFTYVLPYDFDPSARCPEFCKYLNRVLPDQSVQHVMAEFCAWTLTPGLKMEKAMFLHGKGCNGKSVFSDIVEAVFGRDNVSHESLSDLCGDMGDRSRANLSGKLINICSDVAPNALHGDVFKRMVSGEPISTRRLYENVCSITDYGKLMFNLNELPRTNDHSNGYYRRFLIIPFDVQIPKEEIDRKLASRIISNELPGVMNWILEGRDRLVRNEAFSESEILDRTLEDYRNASNTNE